MGYLCMRTKLVWQMSCFKIYDACSQIKDITKKPSKSPSLLHKYRQLVIWLPFFFRKTEQEISLIISVMKRKVVV